MATAIAAKFFGAAANLPPLRAYRGKVFVRRAECVEVAGNTRR
jgi:hypothetical protein